MSGSPELPVIKWETITRVSIRSHYLSVLFRSTPLSFLKMAELTTTKNKRMLNENGFTYTFAKMAKNEDKFWTCSKRPKCKVRIRTNGPPGQEQIIHRLHQHTHGPEADKVEAVRGRTLARQLATTSQDSTGTSEVSGCFFHLAQNHFKKLTRLGLAPRYADDAEFAVQCKMISALAFVPPNDIVQAFEQLPEFLDRALDPMLDYIEQTYIGLPDRRGGRRNPMFPHRLWNMYDRVINRLARTNNAVEAWHRGIEVLLQMAHPTIWKLIDGLRTCQQQNDGRMEQLIAGHAPPQPRTKYRALNQRLETVVGTYAQRTLEDYLRGIAYNFNY